MDRGETLTIPYRVREDHIYLLEDICKELEHPEMTPDGYGNYLISMEPRNLGLQVFVTDEVTIAEARLAEQLQIFLRSCEAQPDYKPYISVPTYVTHLGAMQTMTLPRLQDIVGLIAITDWGAPNQEAIRGCAMAYLDAVGIFAQR